MSQEGELQNETHARMEEEKKEMGREAQAFEWRSLLVGSLYVK